MREFQGVPRKEIQERIDALDKEIRESIALDDPSTQASEREAAAIDTLMQLRFELDLRNDPARVAEFGAGVD